MRGGTAGSVVGAALVVALAAAAGCGDEAVDRCAERTPGTICRVAGTGLLGFNGDGLAAAATDLYWVSQVRRGPDGRVWLMDFNNHKLRVIEDDGTITTLAGSGFHGFADTTVPATESPMENPFDFDFRPGGDVAIASYHDPRILVLPPEGGELASIAGTGSPGAGFPATDGDGGPAIDAAFVELGGLVVAPDGRIFVADLDTSRIRVLEDGLVRAFAGTGERGLVGDGGPATAARLDTPTGLALGPDGSLYVADRRNHVVRRVDPAGVITTVAGTGEAGFAGDGGPATAARLDEPDGVAVSSAGELFVADRGNFRVRRVGADGVIETIAGTGTEGLAGDGGPATDADLGKVARLSWSPGELFVADQSNSVARLVVLDGP